MPSSAAAVGGRGGGWRGRRLDAGERHVRRDRLGRGCFRADVVGYWFGGGAVRVGHCCLLGFWAHPRWSGPLRIGSRVPAGFPVGPCGRARGGPLHGLAWWCADGTGSRCPVSPLASPGSRSSTTSSRASSPSGRGWCPARISLVGFGVDSGIEVAAASVVLVRLTAELRGAEPDERKERIALRFIAVTFFLLAAYLVFEGIRDLLVGERPDSSVVGIMLTGVSIVVMPALAWFKRRVGRRLGSPLVLADAAETALCAWLFGVDVRGFGAVRAARVDVRLDPVAGFRHRRVRGCSKGRGGMAGRARPWTRGAWAPTRGLERWWIRLRRGSPSRADPAGDATFSLFDHPFRVVFDPMVFLARCARFELPVLAQHSAAVLPP